MRTLCRGTTVASRATILLSLLGVYAAPLGRDRDQQPLEPHVTAEGEAPTPFNGKILLQGGTDEEHPLRHGHPRISRAVRLHTSIDPGDDGEKDYNNLLDDGIDFKEPAEQPATPAQTVMHETYANEEASLAARERFSFPAYVVPLSATAHIDRCVNTFMKLNVRLSMLPV